MSKIPLENLTRKQSISTEGLRIIKARIVNERIVCDLVNYKGQLLLSGDAEWVIDRCYERDYTVENWKEATAKLDALASNWGTF